MNDFTLIAQGSALLVVIRMVCFVNLMKQGHVPQRCIFGVLLMGTGALAVLISPFYEVVLGWPAALFATAVAVFVWTDRRTPRAPK
jgi:hypothetical protein